MMRMCSGTNVPGARTSRSSSPFFTESTHNVARSTLGAAGLRPLMTIDTSTIARTPEPQMMYCFLFDCGARLISTKR